MACLLLTHCCGVVCSGAGKSMQITRPFVGDSLCFPRRLMGKIDSFIRIFINVNSGEGDVDQQAANFWFDSALEKLLCGYNKLSMGREKH